MRPEAVQRVDKVDQFLRAPKNPHPSPPHPAHSPGFYSLYSNLFQVSCGAHAHVVLFERVIIHPCSTLTHFANPLGL